MSNHVIYDRIWESRKLARCSLKAALAYPWIYLVADDWGRFEYVPRVIWGKVFGSRNDIRSTEVEAWLKEYQAVGLLDVYEADGRRVAEWHRFTGPPPSKRRAAALPRRDGVYDRAGVVGESRFYLAAHPLPKRSTEGEREGEEGKGKGNGKGEARAACGNVEITTDPPAAPEATAPPALTTRILDLAVRLEDACPDVRALEWIRRASLIQAGNGYPEQSFTDPTRPGLRVAWLETTITKLEQLSREVARPLPP